jgi:MoaA/NifB/PqqE/SkfB family radical SAM enzyme
MANLVITLHCNRQCPFCFARGRVDRETGRDADANMSRAGVRKIMAMLAGAGEKELRLLGGEPTRHPEFAEIVGEVMQQGFRVQVFTNGIMPAETADFLGGFPAERLSVLCNISPQAKDTKQQQQRRSHALERLGERTQLGITITSPDFEFEYLIDAIKELRLAKRIRVGVAQPIVGRDNEFLAPSDYRRAGRRVVQMARACIKEDILIGFDCGLTLCMFSEEELGMLMTCTQKFTSVCHPCIDIGPNLEVWHCFPLSEVLTTSLDDFDTRNEIVEYCNKLVRPYRSMGCMPQCLGCDYLRRGQCTGGCLAHAITGAHPKAPRYAKDLNVAL